MEKDEPWETTSGRVIDLGDPGGEVDHALVTGTGGRDRGGEAGVGTSSSSEAGSVVSSWVVSVSVSATTSGLGLSSSGLLAGTGGDTSAVPCSCSDEDAFFGGAGGGFLPKTMGAMPTRAPPRRAILAAMAARLARSASSGSSSASGSSVASGAACASD